MTLSVAAANRLGFVILGLTNNFAYVIMLSAAYDLLASTTSGQSSHKSSYSMETPETTGITVDVPRLQQQQHSLATNSSSPGNHTEPHCNEHSTSTILLADTLPSLTIKLLYPFLLVQLPTAHKAIATAGLTAAAFIITGLFSSKLLIFIGVICASLSSGVGESVYLSMTSSYGDVSLSGWSMGTGAAGLLGAMAYAILRFVFPIKVIMIVMLVVPITMLIAYFYIIIPVESEDDIAASNGISASSHRLQSESRNDQSVEEFDLGAKVAHLPVLAKYFLPLLLVYFAEYFINQGLFEIIYYPEITYLDHPAQYRWFQVTYQLGVMISRSSLDLFRIHNIWAMSILQFVNSILFLVHAAKIIHLPSFYLVLLIIVYEGLLGGFTYVNAFYRVKNEIEPKKRAFSISTVTVADSLGIVMAGLAAMPVHDALCKLY